MTGIDERLAAVRARIANACREFGRDPAAITLVAVSKTFPAEAIAAVAARGVDNFGENYLQEAMAKIETAERLAKRRLRWHFIGHLQANKATAVASRFDWVHSVDRLRIAQRLSEHRPATLPPLQVLVQVNISGEASKAGCAPEQALGLCRTVAALPGLRLRGLMAIPAPEAADPRRPFRRLRELLERLRHDGLNLDTLSAGMSDDLEAAVAEGATMLRIGTAIFGPRR